MAIMWGGLIEQVSLEEEDWVREGVDQSRGKQRWKRQTGKESRGKERWT